MDELKPVSNRSHNWLGLGATLVDCLDNLTLTLTQTLTLTLTLTLPQP